MKCTIICYKNVGSVWIRAYDAYLVGEIYIL